MPARQITAPHAKRHRRPAPTLLSLVDVGRPVPTTENLAAEDR